MDSTAATALPDLWDRLVGTQPDPDLWVVIATMAAALAVVVPHTLWRLSRNAITIAHEGAHGHLTRLRGCLRLGQGQAHPVQIMVKGHCYLNDSY